MTSKFKDRLGRVIMTSDGLSELIMKQRSIAGLLVEECDDTLKYNQLSDGKLTIYTDDIANQTKEKFDSVSTASWKTPKEYQISDEELVTWLFEQCLDDEEYNRVLKELNMYDERGLYPLLKHLIFLIDRFRENKIVWGVGRGSSVSSYILYLIGVHHVDSLKYNLDITDFLK